MKKVLWICLLSVIGLCMTAQAQTVTAWNDSPKTSTTSLKEEAQWLWDQIASAKAAGLPVENAWVERLEAIERMSGGSTTLDGVGGDAVSADPVTSAGGSCATATEITTLPYVDSGTLDLENNCPARPYNDVFYRFTAVEAGDYQASMCDSYSDTYMRIWLGGECCAGSDSATADDECGNDPRITLHFSAGQTVYFECGRYTATTGTRTYRFTLTRILPPPVNDLCADAIPVEIPSETFGTTTNGTVDATPSCGTAGTPSASGVWYSLVGNGHILTASTCDGRTTYDTKLTVYRGSCGAMTCVAGNDDDASCDVDTSSLVSWCAETGVTYYVLVHGYLTHFGNFRLHISSGDVCGSSCDAMPLCGQPAEFEPNNTCGTTTAQPVIVCDGAVFGRICPAGDIDWWTVTVPPQNMMQLSLYDGGECATNPAGCLRATAYNLQCQVISNTTTGGFTITNSGTEPWTLLIRLAGADNCLTTYKLVGTCCAFRDYCAEPIEVPGVLHYESTVNTCCATDPVPSVHRNDCADSVAYVSGTDVIYKINLAQATILDAQATGGDAQIMIFTDCQNPLGTCVAARDAEVANPETISDLALNPGVYYISISQYNTACGPMTLVLDGDYPLPVELTGFDALPGDASMRLTWSTASETSNDRFEIARDGLVVARVATQGNGAAGHRYTWTDAELENGRMYRYDLYCVDAGGVRELLQSAEGMPDQSAAQATEYRLYQNYPNPFNPQTQIAFDLLENGSVSLKVYNLLGQMVADLAERSFAAGHHTVRFDAAGLPSGIYVYRLNVNGFVSEKKMLLMK